MRRVPPSAPGLLPACNNNNPYVYIGCLNVEQAARLSSVKTKSRLVIAPTNPSFVPAAGQRAACPTRYLEPDVYKQVKPEWQPRLLFQLPVSKETRAFPSQIECRTRRIVSR